MYDLVLQIEPESLKAWYFKTTLHMKLGQEEEAKACGKKTIELAPKWKNKVEEILDSTSKQETTKPKLEKTRKTWTKEDDILDRLYQSMFVDEVEQFDPENWYDRLGMMAQRTRRNKKSVHLLLDSIAESDSMSDMHFEQVVYYAVDALFRGFDFCFDKMHLVGKLTQALHSAGFQVDETKYGHLTGDPQSRIAAHIYCSFIEKLMGTDEKVVYVEEGAATPQNGWSLRHGFLCLTAKSLYAVGHIGYNQKGDKGVLVSGEPWRPFHRHVDIYPLNSLGGTRQASIDKSGGKALILGLQDFPHYACQKRKERKFGGGYETKISHKLQRGDLLLYVSIQRHDEEDPKSIELRLNALEDIIKFLCGQAT